MIMRQKSIFAAAALLAGLTANATNATNTTSAAEHVKPSASSAPVSYRNVTVDGVRIAYREAGSPDKPTLLLLHGVPSSSRMYDGLMRKLGDRYHLIAPDYPGFGNSDAPSPENFAYTFDHLAQVMQKFTVAVHAPRYVLFMQDYGAPVGMRMATAQPEAVQGTIFQNGNVYEEGLGAMWATRKPFWNDRAAHEQAVRTAHLSLAVTRGRHIGTDPAVEAYDPDLWMDEVAYLNRPGQAAIQADLIFDYQNNIAAYPAWQKWLAAHQLPTLVVWGKYDPAFIVPGAEAFRRDLPKARIELLDAGHFAMDTKLDEVAALTDQYMQVNRKAFAAGK
jgi:pimeloyl-ACP methyl ester carboxylesterase